MQTQVLFIRFKTKSPYIAIATILTPEFAHESGFVRVTSKVQWQEQQPSEGHVAALFRWNTQADGK